MEETYNLLRQLAWSLWPVLADLWQQDVPWHIIACDLKQVKHRVRETHDAKPSSTASNILLCSMLLYVYACFNLS